MTRFNKFLAVAALMFSANAAQATVVNLDYSAMGSYTAFGSQLPSYVADDTFSRTFTVFDVSGLDMSKLVSAVFTVDTLGYAEQTNERTLTLWDVETKTDTLIKGNGDNSGIYADLGSGVSYGSFTTVEGQTLGDIISVVLNANGLAALSDNNGYFAFGGSLGNDELGFTMFTKGNSVPRLSLTFADGTVSPVPNPPAYMMMFAGLMLIGSVVAKRKQSV